MKSIFRPTAILLVLTLWGTQAFAQNAKPIKIGEINSYSTLPQFTEPYRNGWKLAVEEINAGGGINGRMIEVISRDDAGKPEQAIRQAQALLSNEKVDLLAGTYLSNIGMAVARIAARNKKLFVAAGPLSDVITLDRGNRYTFRLRPSTYMQTAMLVEEAAKLPIRRWATIAPNYEYGQSAVASFRLLLKAKRPDVKFVAEQWPALGKLDPVAAVQALARAKPEGIFNATFGADQAKFVREGNVRGLFAKTTVASMLSGEPEQLALLKEETPKGWIVTGYPWSQIDTPEHSKFRDAYHKKYSDYPRLGSVIGYSMVLAIAEGIKKARSTDSDQLIVAMRGLSFVGPLGPVTFRAIDQQSTMGAYVGRLEQQDGKGSMSHWRYADGKDYLPDLDYVKSRRPGSAME